MTAVAINGFGRVGRCAFRSAFERGAAIEWVGINDLADARTLAHLLRHDSVYGPFPAPVMGTGAAPVRLRATLPGPFPAPVMATGDALVVDGVTIPVFGESEPAALPWSEVGADVVLEC